MLTRLWIILAFSAVLYSRGRVVQISQAEVKDFSPAQICDNQKDLCEPESCMRNCLEEGDDQMECQYNCYDHV